MRHRRRSHAATLVAVALAAAVSLGLLEGFFPHTDDGCQVEVHCLACRLALASASTTPRQVVSHVILESVGAPTPATTSARLDLPTKGPSSRGPPSSSC